MCNKLSEKLLEYNHTASCRGHATGTMQRPPPGYATLMMMMMINHRPMQFTNTYVHCRRCDTSTAVDRLEECITEVRQWMSANRLKLNADKTGLLWAGSKHGLVYFGSNRPSLRLGADTDSEWACSFARLWPQVWRSTLTLFVPSVSSGFASWKELGDH